MVSCAPVGNRRRAAICKRRQAGYQPAAGCQPAPPGGAFRHYIIFWASIAALLLVASLLQAKRLPIKTYTTADGLARDHILCIVQDSHGFLWFCTAEGLSRFDGYQFTNYHTEQGLPGNLVTDFIEARAGDYWIATTDGLARFDPKGAGASRFHRYPLGGVGKPVPVTVREDGAGGIWCGTSTGEGVFYLSPNDTAFRRINVPMADRYVTALLI